MWHSSQSAELLALTCDRGISSPVGIAAHVKDKDLRYKMNPSAQFYLLFTN